MSHHSTKFVTDLGDQLRCDTNKSLSFPTRYSMLMANATNLPVKVMVGLCLPEVCHQDYMEDVAETMTVSVNGALDLIDKELPNGLDTFGVNIVRSNFTRLSVDIV